MTELNDAGLTSEADTAWMRRALALAERAQGRTAPNPAVGAVLVRNGAVVGEGWTAPPGGPHAEIVALRLAGDFAQGATLYVTLEPCAHYGRTPPCAPELVRAGIARVVIANPDPFPHVSGRGIELLEQSGVAVALGVEAAAAIALNAGFFKRVQSGFPEVTAKYAMTLDGRIATRTGHSRWITGADARHEAHRLRDRHDAIVVGVGTVLADDSLLTTRLPIEDTGDGGPHHPLRVVLDSLARTPLDSAMLKPETPGATLIAVTERASASAVAALRSAGAGVALLPACDGRVEPRALLRLLAERGVNSVLVEGGASVLGAFFDADLIDSVVAFIAPVIVGGAFALSPVGGVGRDHMHLAARLGQLETRTVGTDFMISGRVHPLPTLEELLCSVESSKRSATSSHSTVAEGTTH